MNRNAFRILNTIQMVGALILFIGVELLIVIALRKNRVDSPQDVFTNIYAVCFMAAIPALAGARGVHVAKRLLSRPDVTEITRQRLNELFLSVVIFAYVALAFIMVILERLNRR